MTELKPCPFCGGKAELKTFWGGFHIRRYINVVQCTSCRANSGEWKIKPKAIEAWNRRVTDERDSN